MIPLLRYRDDMLANNITIKESWNETMTNMVSNNIKIKPKLLKNKWEQIRNMVCIHFGIDFFNWTR